METTLSKSSSIDPNRQPLEREIDRGQFLTVAQNALDRAAGSGATVAILYATFTPQFPSGENGELRDLEESFFDAAAQALLEKAGSAFPEGSAVHLMRPARDSFAVLLPPSAKTEDAMAAASSIRQRFEGSISVRGLSIRATVAMGVSSAPPWAANAEALVQQAETAAYCARFQSNSQLQVYCEYMNRWAPERQKLEKDLREAIDRKELLLYYQPRVRATDQKIVGFEALVRWKHPERGLVSPGQFIPIAEEAGIIVGIGEWVLREACRQAKAWRDQGMPKVHMSVNLSPAQFRKADLYETICTVLKDTGLEADALELELTEGMLMTDPKSAITTLQRLKTLGVHLSIDDFGTGYSSLSYLRRFPIDALKIDQSFVREVTSKPEDAAITTAIILLGHSLKLSVIAEGVETDSQLKFLQVLQCNEIQGFLVSRPVPADQAAKLLAADAQKKYES